MRDPILLFGGLGSCSESREIGSSERLERGVTVLLEFEGTSPQVHESVFVAPGARIVGDVVIGPGSSVWYNAVIRGDVFPIRIGAQVNIQDLTMVHVTTGKWATTIEDKVTVGHNVTLHGCTLREGALIGMGSVVMDRADVGAYSIVGAGSLVTEGTVIPEGSLAMGSPARVKRPLTPEELAFVKQSAGHYETLAERHRKSLDGSGGGE